MSEVQAFPLCWPAGVPRTERPARSNFSRRVDAGSEQYRWKRKEGLTLHQARERLSGELSRLHAREVVLSTNVELRLDGLPRSGRRAPDDAGVAVYFTVGGEQRCIPCDRWDRVPDNIAAIAKAIEALRGLERWVNDSSVRAAFAGFAALPESIEEDWRQVLQLQEVQVVTPEVVRRAHKALAQRNHPDRGGSDEQMARINAARDEALRELRNA